jgi:hypothetical protein
MSYVLFTALIIRFFQKTAHQCKSPPAVCVQCKRMPLAQNERLIPLYGCCYLLCNYHPNTSVVDLDPEDGSESIFGIQTWIQIRDGK